MKIEALVLLGPGTNRDRDAAEALEAAGAEARTVPVGALAEVDFGRFGLLVLPGGFSYGDALGAGALLALDLRRRFAEEVTAFVNSGRPVLGICNGFQALVKSGILPGPILAEPDRGRGRAPSPAPVGREGGSDPSAAAEGPALPSRDLTLARNARGDFECRWVSLIAPPSRCLWTEGLVTFSCPVAHGEGRIALRDEGSLSLLRGSGRVALRYARPDGSPAEGVWPENPNGSAYDIAGLCNEAGNVLGLMPHPENAIRPRRRSRGAGDDRTALRLFENGIARARSL